MLLRCDMASPRVFKESQIRFDSIQYYLVSVRFLLFTNYYLSYRQNVHSFLYSFFFLVAANIPYSISPRLKARCIRSRQYASRKHLTYFRGLKIHPRGSYTPTQIECRHDAIVSSTQLAVLTFSITPVPSINLANSCTEIKYGCVHSSYRNCKSRLSFLSKG